MSSHSSFHLLVESVEDYAIFMLDPRGVITTWNIGAKRMKGWEGSEIIGQPLDCFFTPEDRASGKAARELEQAKREGRYEEEGWRVRKDGSRFWAHVVLTALRDEKGELVGFAKVTHDLTERRRAEDERVRLAQEASARRVAEQTAEMLARLNAITGALAAARTPEDVARVMVESAEVLGAQAAAFIRPAHKTEWVERPNELALPLEVDGEVVAVVAYRFDGERTFSREERALLRTMSAQAAQAYARALAHAREEATNERLAVLVDLSAALSSTLSLSDVAHVVIERGMRMAGANTCMLHALDEGAASLALVDQRGCGEEMVERVRKIAYDEAIATWTETRDEYAALVPAIASMPGSRVSSFWSLPLVAEGRVIGLLSMGFFAPRRFSAEERDLARGFAHQCANAMLRAKRLEAERDARANADVANRAKDEFLAIVSHELRTPLNAIVGWAKLMAAADFDDSRRGRAVETIVRNAVAMTQLIEDLLDMSRIVSGKMRLEVQPLHIAPIISAALDSINPAAEAKEIEITTSLDKSVSPLVGDPTRLQQIVWNLLSNAVKFTPRGGKVRVVLREEDGYLRIEVSDTGVGIAPDFLPQVFDAFSQEDARISRARGGLGLGLAITRQLVELHGGRIDARSDGDGRGSTFVVRIPSTARVSDAPSARAPSNRPPQQLQGVRVLVVDDEPDARELAKAILDGCGCEVVVAASVLEALDTFARDPPDVLLADISMPERDGYDLIRHVRTMPRDRGGNVPAAALTAFTRVEDKRKILDAGYTMHVAKPIEPAELAEIVASLTRFTTATRVP